MRLDRAQPGVAAERQLGQHAAQIGEILREKAHQAVPVARLAPGAAQPVEQRRAGRVGVDQDLGVEQKGRVAAIAQSRGPGLCAGGAVRAGRVAERAAEQQDGQHGQGGGGDEDDGEGERALHAGRPVSATERAGREVSARASDTACGGIG